MPLIVQPDGTVAEGNIPVGGTKVLVLFDGQIQEAFVSQEAPVSTGEVTREKLQYDNLTIAKKAFAPVSAIVLVQETQKKAVEMVTAAFAAELTETAKKAIEKVFAEFVIKEFAQKAVDTTSVVGRVLEVNQKSTDTISSEVVVSEVQQKAVEDISNTVTGIVSELNQKAVDNIETAIIARIDENKEATEAVTSRFNVSEIQQKATEDISNTVINVVSEINQKAVDNIEAAIIARIDENKEASDIASISVSYTGYANQNVSTTGWVNPANALNDTTGTASTLTATSSGLAGTTSNTTTGTITLGLENPSPLIGDLNISGSAIVEVERQITGAGTLPIGQSHNIAYEYQIVGQGAGTYFSPQRASTASQGGTSFPAQSGGFSLVIERSSGGALPSLVGSSGSQSSTLNFPANIQVGDLLIYAFTKSTDTSLNYTNAQIIPSGFNFIRGIGDYVTYNSASEAQDLRGAALFWKIATSEDINRTFVSAASNAYYIQSVTAYRNSRGIGSSTSDQGSPYTVGPHTGLLNDKTFYFFCSAGSVTGGQASQPTVPSGTSQVALYGANSGATSVFATLADETMQQAAVGWQPIASDVGTTGSIAKGFVSVNVSNLSVADVDNLQVRAVGTVVSGTGLGASKSASIFRARVRFNAEKDY